MFNDQMKFRRIKEWMPWERNEIIQHPSHLHWVINNFRAQSFQIKVWEICQSTRRYIMGPLCLIHSTSKNILWAPHTLKWMIIHKNTKGHQQSQGNLHQIIIWTKYLQIWRMPSLVTKLYVNIQNQER